MKKIININLSGRVIPIEDAAYERLQQYIESLRRYFAGEEGRDEIINDIESRVAELMNDVVRKSPGAVVTEADMEKIINTLGRVEDFEEADAAEPAAAGQTFSNAHAEGFTGKRRPGRLSRDASDKILGGVCSGLASFMNVDPAIVRLLFAIITFGGFGTGVLIYILLWIILPARQLQHYTGKRLFRNPDDRMLGGVAGGLAVYFNKDAWIFRAIFAAPLIINIVISIVNSASGDFFHGFPNFFVGSFTGTFFLIYIVLWVVLPEARSPYDRMEMRGEKVDVNSIKQNVQQNMGDLENRAKAWGEELTQTANQWSSKASQFANTRGKTFAYEVSDSGRTIGRNIGSVIGRLFKAFFLFFFGMIAFGLFVAIVMFAVSGLAQPFSNFMLNGFWQKALLWSSLVLFIGVPLVALITWIVRRMMRVRSQKRYLGWTFGGLWTLGWITSTLFAASITKDFRNYERRAQVVAIAPATSGKLTLRVDEPAIRYSGTYPFFFEDRDDDDNQGWDLTEDSLLLTDIRITINKSPDSQYRASVIKFSRGQNRPDAAGRINNLQYEVTAADSSLVLPSHFGIYKGDKYRNQRVNVIIEVPAGKKIRFDNSLRHVIHSSIRYNRDDNRWSDNWDNGDWMGISYDNDYVMQENGRLKNLDAKTEDQNNEWNNENDRVYEYNDSARGLDQKIQELEERRRELIEKQRQKVEEENQRLREMEQKEDSGVLERRTGSLKRNSMPMLATPVFSLMP